jgi:tyrosyl-tRNA synthetase
VTRLVHGQAALDAAIKASEILFGAEIGDTSEETFKDVVGEIPTKPLERAKLEGTGSTLIDLLVLSGLCPSKGQAKKDLEGGGIYVNNVRESSITRAISTSDLLFGKYLLLRKGKRTYTVLNVT